MLVYMIDIHSHILPAVDDGSRSVEESIEMGRQEAEGGTTTIFATPHVYTNADFPKSDSFVQKVIDLQGIFDQEGVPLKIAQGAEVFPMMEILDALGAGHPITLGGKRKHILLDLPLGQSPMILDKLTFELLANGITPILAHPERTAPVQDSIEVLIPFLERGVLCQVNAGSLFGRYGSQAQKRGLEILTRQWAHFMASDMHRPGSRGPILRFGKAQLAGLPADYLEDITVRNPGKVLAGQSVPQLDYDLLVVTKPKKFLGIFKKRG
jgi:protein-tyrosine phosphatase